MSAKTHGKSGPNVTEVHPVPDTRAPQPTARMHRVTLHLARNSEHPDGNPNHGYVIIAPLDAAGYIDAAAWREARERCTVRRFREDRPDRIGKLVHRAGGVDGATWLIDYDAATDTDDEAGFRLSTHRFHDGEYVSIRDEDGVVHTFRIVMVEPLGLPSHG